MTRQSNRSKDASQATGEGVALSWAAAAQRQRLQLDREVGTGVTTGVSLRRKIPVR